MSMLTVQVFSLFLEEILMQSMRCMVLAEKFAFTKEEDVLSGYVHGYVAYKVEKIFSNTPHKT